MTTSSQARFYILTGDVSFNRGDRINLQCQINLIRSRFPNSDITACTLCPENDSKDFDIRIIRKGLLVTREQIYYLRRADVVVWGGGALLADHSCRLLIPYWLFILGLIKFVLRKKIMGWAQGVVLRTRMGKEAARLCCSMAERMTVRDAFSYRQLNSIGVTNLTKTADPAVLGGDILQPPKSLMRELEEIKQAPLGLAVTFWHYHNSQKALLPYLLRCKLGIRPYSDLNGLERYREVLASFVNELLAKTQSQLVLIPRYIDPRWREIEYLHALRDATSHPERVRVLEEGCQKPADYLQLLSGLSGLVAIPLHDAICASCVEIPFVTVAYEEKCSEFMHSVGAAARLFQEQDLYDGEGRARIIAELQKTQANWSECCKAQRQGIQTLRRLAEINIELLEQLHVQRCQN